MRDRNKNKKISLNDFISYRDDKMNGEERNAFERELQKDPFSKEASEGFASVTTREASDDMHDLHESLDKRISPGKRSAIYRIAAAVAILMVISSVVIIVQVKRPSNHIAMDNGQKRPLEIAEAQPITRPATKEESFSGPAAVQSPGKNERADNAAVPVTAEAFKAEPANEMAISQNNDSLAELRLRKAEVYSRKAQIAAAPAAAKEDSYAGDRVTGMDISFEADKKSEEYIYPHPVGGKDEFERYIRENIRWTDTSAANHKVVVVLGFKVRTDGSLDSIKIIKSPGKAFSDEAIRLLRSGPAWNPAKDGGRPVEDEVRLRIVFK
jgi:hypothetical protein